MYIVIVTQIQLYPLYPDIICIKWHVGEQRLLVFSGSTQLQITLANNIEVPLYLFC